MAFSGIAVGARHSTCDEGVQSREESEVLVIGGGIVGAAVAFFLTNSNDVRDVTLLERGTVSCEASGLSAGTIWNAGVPSTIRIEDVVMLLRAKSAALLEVLGGCDFNCCGALDVAATPAEAKLLRADFEQQVRQGLNVEWLGSPTEVVAMEPALEGGSALCATHTPMSGSVQPALATQRFAALAAANGCSVVEGAECVSLTPFANKHGTAMVEATTADGRRYCAKHVVIASGHRSVPLAHSLGVSLPLVPVKGVICVSTAHAEPGALKKVIFDMGIRLHMDEHGSGRDDPSGVPAKCTHEASGERRCRKLYGKQAGASDDHMILFGGDRLPGAAADDYEPPAASTATIRDHVRELCPSLKGFHGENGGTSDEQAHSGEWAGIMPFSRDGRPIVGSLAPFGLPNCWLACGFGPSGIMEGPAAAELLAARVAGKSDGEAHADRLVIESLDPCRPGCCERVVAK